MTYNHPIGSRLPPQPGEPETTIEGQWFQKCRRKIILFWTFFQLKMWEKISEHLMGLSFLNRLFQITT